MRYSNRTVLRRALAISLGLIGLAPAAAFAVNVGSPYGSTPTEITIGHEASSGEIWVAVVASTGQCSITQIGTPSGLFEDTNIFGGSGNDQINIVSSTNAPVCGLSFSGQPNFGNHFIDLYGGAGNDTIVVPSGNIDSWLFGGPGNDLLVTSSNLRSELYGEDGNDSLLTAGVTTQDEILNGGNGSDCLLDRNDSYRILDCAAGGSACSGFACDVRSNFTCTIGTNAETCIGWRNR
jgi:Ca2+-binding RTX toxin-like protein